MAFHCPAVHTQGTFTELASHLDIKWCRTPMHIAFILLVSGQNNPSSLKADDLALKSCRWASGTGWKRAAEQSGHIWMWKVTSIGKWNACCAGAWLVENPSELAACGNPVPSLAPRWDVCMFANTRSYLILSVGLFWLLTKCCELQIGVWVWQRRAWWPTAPLWGNGAKRTKSTGKPVLPPLC